MVDDGTVQSYLDLSLKYLQAAEDSARANNAPPAYHNALHALELGVKAALATRLTAVPETHNVGGLFGREFRASVGVELCSRVSSLLHDYDGPRYPEWDVPDGWTADITFVSDFLRATLPSLIERGRVR